MQSLTMEQVAKLKSARKGEFLTTAELAVYVNRSIGWIQAEVKAGRITADAKINSGKRGRPGSLYKKGNFALMAKKHAKQAAARTAKAAPVSETVAA